MEKYQILKPRRTRGTPYQKFLFKSFAVAVVVGLGIVWHFKFVNSIKNLIMRLVFGDFFTKANDLSRR